MPLPTRLFAAALLAAATPALAAPLSTDRLTFRADGPQSAYGTGAAETRSGSLTLPLPFEAEVPFDLIVGSDRTPNPERIAKTAERELAVVAYEAARRSYELVRKERDRINDFLEFTYPGLLLVYEADLKTWQGCRLLPFGGCGKKPSRPARPQLPDLPPAPGVAPPLVTVPRTIDTRAGVAGEVYVKGRAELVKGSVSMGPVSVELGPAAPFEVEWAPDEGRIPLFDDTFPLQGFSPLTGTPFIIETRWEPVRLDTTLSATSEAVLVEYRESTCYPPCHEQDAERNPPARRRVARGCQGGAVGYRS
ncbi:MAG: hypothetical protein GY798_20940 [Hyphomicrobiales bacterium]|nr:hypothetical protein [Hyphomicrobiales bacterium]